MSVSYWNKVQVLNKSDLNQVAAQHLRALGEDPDPGSLHSFQLAQHLLENSPEQVPGPADKWISELLGLVQAAQQGDPEKNQKLLFNLAGERNDPEAPVWMADQLADELAELSPINAAALLVENFYWSLSEQNPALLGPITED